MESSDDNPELNSDMLLEILSRSSFQTVAKCRLLSNKWNRFTYRSYFTNLHSQRTNTVSGFFFQRWKFSKSYANFFSSPASSHDFSLDFLPSTSFVTIKASSLQGLLVCVDGTSSRRRVPTYFVCKPATKEWLHIPNPKTRYFTEKIGIKVIKANPLQYKIVRFSKPKDFLVGQHYCLGCEIFCSVRGKWKQIEHVKLPYGDNLVSVEAAVSAGGKLHWLTSEKNVLSFDVDDEKYCLSLLPSMFYDENYHRSCLKLTDYEGKLALICEQDKSFMLWVMEHKEWRERFRVITDSVKGEAGGYCNSVAFSDSDVAVFSGFYRLLFFKFKNGIRIDKVPMDDHNLSPQEVFPFQSDFELCNLKNEVFKKQSNRKPRRNRSKPREKCLNNLTSDSQCSFSLNPIFLFLFLSLFFTLVCFILLFL